LHPNILDRSTHRGKQSAGYIGAEVKDKTAVCRFNTPVDKPS